MGQEIKIRSNPGKSGQIRAKPVKSGQIRAKPVKSGQIRTNPDKSRNPKNPSQKIFHFLKDFHSLRRPALEFFSISHALKLFIHNVYLRVREDEDIAFCISRSRSVSFNRKLNSFFCVHQPQS